MAYPVILVNSGTGSDSCDTAALRGTSASTDVAGTTVTLDGSPDLSLLATDGSAWIQIRNATAGARNFSKITGKDNTGKTVTVSPAFAGSLSGKKWAINQTLASIGNSDSIKLFSNNGSEGDAMPGWTVMMTSGHAETIASTYHLRRSGDVTDGPVRLIGDPDAGTRPVVTFSNNGDGFSVSAVNNTILDGFDLKNSNATKTASRAVFYGSSTFAKACRLRIADGTNNFWKGIVGNSSASSIIVVEECEIANCVDDGIVLAAVVRLNFVHDNGGDGVLIGAQSPHRVIQENIIVDNGGIGLSIGAAAAVVRGNTIAGNGDHGIELTATTESAMRFTIIENNTITDNGGYGVKADAGVSGALIAAAFVSMRGNNFGTGGTANTSGAFSSNLADIEQDSVYVDPGFVDAGSGDYGVGTNLKAAGVPLGTIGYSGTSSYVDIGAAQREEPSASGTPAFASFG